MMAVISWGWPAETVEYWADNKTVFNIINWIYIFYGARVSFAN